MEELIEYTGYMPVASIFAGCAGCAFEHKPKLRDCFKVACHPNDFPIGHDLRKATNVIWIKES